MKGDELLTLLSQVPIQQPQLGTGLAQGAADIKQLYAIWQQQAINAQMQGTEFPPFTQWLAMQGQQNPSMPRD